MKIDDVIISKVKSYEGLCNILNELGVRELAYGKNVVIKPNLTVAKPYPTTTNVRLVEELIKYFIDIASGVIVGEGSGGCSTWKAFEALGYVKLIERYGIELIDFNEAEIVRNYNERCFILKELPLPKVLVNAYVVSVSNLKHHSAASVTLSLKNMMGIAPGRFFSPAPWNKANFHEWGLDECIVDVNIHKRPDLALIDGIVAQLGAEIVGLPKRFDVMIASLDPVACDSIGSYLLGLKPRGVKHIRLAEGKGIGKIVDLRLDRKALDHRPFKTMFSIPWRVLSRLKIKTIGVA